MFRDSAGVEKHLYPLYSSNLLKYRKIFFKNIHKNKIIICSIIRSDAQTYGQFEDQQSGPVPQVSDQLGGDLLPAGEPTAGGRRGNEPGAEADEQRESRRPGERKHLRLQQLHSSVLHLYLLLFSFFFSSPIPLPPSVTTPPIFCFFFYSSPVSENS